MTQARACSRNARSVEPRVMRDTAIRHNNVTWCQSADVPAAHDDAAAAKTRRPDVSKSELGAVGADGTVRCVKQS